MSRRTVLTLAGWLAAVAAATAVGAGAVQLIGAGITTGGTGVLTPEQVAAQLTTAPVAPTAPASPSPSPSRSPQSNPASHGPSKPLSGPGGTVVAACYPDGLAYLLNWTPAQGYRVERVERGPYEHADVRFERPAGRSEVRVRCAAGEPVAQWSD
ncbi:MAG TPA: hypothetical protein VF062_01805 [Candidatus Limnocylindrales bacterium]